MKKITLFLIVSLFLSITPVVADEGMWLLPLLEKLNGKKMKELGFKLSAKDIYDINNSSLKDAVVHFGGGCTAEIISDQGLVLTNHHCGYGAIQRLSTVENDFLQNGFWATSQQAELPAALSVTFLESFTDVTAQVNASTNGITDEAKQTEARLNAIKAIEDAAKTNKYLTARVSSFFGGNQYFLIVSKVYEDVRFVGAPPSSIGKFGADTDNWMWPRHTGDFSMFRVYADKDGNPAPYSKDNTPLKPKKSLTISIKGIQEGDFSMIIGYPGRTSRYMTSFELKERTDISNAIRIYSRGIRQDVMLKDMLADPKVRLQYANKFAGSSNYWKNSIGMNEAVKKLKVTDKRVAEEKAFSNWVKADPARAEQYGSALKEIEEAVNRRSTPLYVYTYLTESLNNIEISGVASLFRDILPLLEKESSEELTDKIKNALKRTESFYTNYNAPTDKKVTAAMIQIYREKVDKAYYPSFFKIIDDQFGGSIDAYVDFLFTNSIFTSAEKLTKALSDNPKAILSDPAYEIYKSITLLVPSIQKQIVESTALFNKGQKAFIAGLMEMNAGKAMYPDANSTMRLTYGQVMSYKPKDAVKYEFVTTLDGVMEKEDSTNWEFVVPSKLKELYNTKDFGQYALKDGRMPVAFISTNDITGGNSGSPVLNAKGELIGTAFDGNWEAMSGDIVFEPNLQRCINVDIRYTLFIIEKFGGAKWLIDEMKIVK